MFLAAVFCSFSLVGFVNDILVLGSSSPPRLAVQVLSSGLVAAFYAVCAFRGTRWLAVAVAAHVALVLTAGRLVPAPTVPVVLDAAALAAVRSRLALDGVGSMLCMVAGYAFFVTFISTEGQRYLRVHTEMVLAEHIHQSLVPPIDTRAGGLEIVGRSMPSGEVGGDLVDVVQTADGCVAMVADVSGHGVPSGVLTAMVKSAARMRLRSPAGAATLLSDLNDTLVPVIEPNMFVTAACLHRSASGAVTLAAAGHPPLLHFRRATGDIVEHNTPNLALGLFPGETYVAAPIDTGPGDVLLLLTDGLTEVFDRRDEEFGLPGVKRVLQARAAEPLAAIADALRQAALAHGPQVDDQTMLLVRV
jgi:sigma-B regulation protein RsbU (phosphoserine phosphatase)